MYYPWEYNENLLHQKTFHAGLRCQQYKLSLGCEHCAVSRKIKIAPVLPQNEKNEKSKDEASSSWVDADGARLAAERLHQLSSSSSTSSSYPQGEWDATKVEAMARASETSRAGATVDKVVAQVTGKVTRFEQAELDAFCRQCCRPAKKPAPQGGFCKLAGAIVPRSDSKAARPKEDASTSCGKARAAFDKVTLEKSKVLDDLFVLSLHRTLVEEMGVAVTDGCGQMAYYFAANREYREMIERCEMKWVWVPTEVVRVRLALVVLGPTISVRRTLKAAANYRKISTGIPER